MLHLVSVQLPALLSPFVTYLYVIGPPCIPAALKHILVAGTSESCKENRPLFQGPWAPCSVERAHLHTARCTACPGTVHSPCCCPAAAHVLTQPLGRRAEARPRWAPSLPPPCFQPLLLACPLSPPCTVMRPFVSSTEIFACLFARFYSLCSVPGPLLGAGM